MEAKTAIDHAHAAMADKPDDDAARLHFYERIADGELFLLLKQEPRGDDILPEMIAHEGRNFVLAFDLEERLAEFSDDSAPYVALSGRALAGMLAPQAIGLALNPGVAPSAIFLPAEALRWLADTLEHAPGIMAAQIREVHPPKGLPRTLLQALDTKLSGAAGLARSACLAAVHYGDDSRGHLIGFLDAPEGARAALTQAVAEALTFSGLEAGALDVGFFDSDAPVGQSLIRVGLRLDLPDPVQPRGARAAPGSDPQKPPILR